MYRLGIMIVDRRALSDITDSFPFGASVFPPGYQVLPPLDCGGGEEGRRRSSFFFFSLSPPSLRPE